MPRPFMLNPKPPKAPRLAIYTSIALSLLLIGHITWKQTNKQPCVGDSEWRTMAVGKPRDLQATQVM